MTARKTGGKGRNAVAVESVPDRQHMSVSIRKIDNGYIVSRSTDDPKTGYKSTETFSPKRPRIEIPVVSDDKPKPKPKPRARK